MGFYSWGHSTVIVSNEQYVIKELVLPSGQEIPWHRHATKHETHICAQGEGRVIVWSGTDSPRPAEGGGVEWFPDADVHILRPGRYFDVPPGVWHKIRAITPLTIMEPQGTNVEDIEWLNS